MQKILVIFCVTTSRLFDKSGGWQTGLGGTSSNALPQIARVACSHETCPAPHSMKYRV